MAGISIESPYFMEALKPHQPMFKVDQSLLFLRSLFSKMNDDSGADAEVVVVVVASVVECCQQVVGFDKTNGETRGNAQVQPSGVNAARDRACGRSPEAIASRRPTYIVCCENTRVRSRFRTSKNRPEPRPLAL
jgi:hypothetical protein